MAGEGWVHAVGFVFFFLLLLFISWDIALRRKAGHGYTNTSDAIVCKVICSAKPHTSKHDKGRRK